MGLGHHSITSTIIGVLFLTFKTEKMIHLDETQVGQATLLNEMDSRLGCLKELDLIHKLNPSFSKDGNQFCYLYGDNLQVGVAGFGYTAAEAMSEFYRSFFKNKA